jgi:hypothetical protein
MTVNTPRLTDCKSKILKTSFRNPIAIVVAVAICLVAASTRAVAAPHKTSSASEFLAFLSADQLYRYQMEDEAMESSDFTPVVDLLYSHTRNSWRFLAEYLLTDDEHELERLLVGYDASEESTFWLGRFHQPSSAWIAKYHHGRFLQTSISRPAIEEWEDDGGVLPSHISGVLLEHGIPLSKGNGSRVSMSIGAGPYLQDGELRPVDLLDPGDGDSGLGASLNYAYFPDYVAESNFGFAFEYSQIIVEENAALGIDQSFDINQTVLGAQVDWRRAAWQLIGAAYYVNNDSEDLAGRFGGWFLSGYAQLQFELKGKSTVFGRGEFSNNTGSADYLTLFPDFSTGRIVAGFQYQFLDNQAFTIEVSDESTLKNSFGQVQIQWSAVFP